MVGLFHKTKHVNRPFEYRTIWNLNFKKFGIQMVGIHIPTEVFFIYRNANAPAFVGRIVKLYQTDVGSRMAHVCKFFFGQDTVLADSADPW